MTGVHALVIDCGRWVGDDLPRDATGARVVCYAPGADLDAAIEAARAVLTAAGMAPLTGAAFGDVAERASGGELTASERLLMDRALRTGRVVIADLAPIYRAS